MNELQRSKLMSHKSVMEVLTLFQFIWNENEAVNEVMAEFEANLKKTEEMIEMPLDSQGNSEKGAYLLNTLFEEMDELLTAQLDKLLLRYALSHADFFHAYGNARTVKNYGLGYDSLKPREPIGGIRS